MKDFKGIISKNESNVKNQSKVILILKYLCSGQGGPQCCVILD
jgi:hypothetical protein